MGRAKNHTIFKSLYFMYIVHDDMPVSMAQWVKPLLIGHSAYWPDGLRALTACVQIQVWKGVFRLDQVSGHAMRLNSRLSKL